MRSDCQESTIIEGQCYGNIALMGRWQSWCFNENERVTHLGALVQGDHSVPRSGSQNPKTFLRKGLWLSTDAPCCPWWKARWGMWYTIKEMRIEGKGAQSFPSSKSLFGSCNCGSGPTWLQQPFQDVTINLLLIWSDLRFMLPYIIITLFFRCYYCYFFLKRNFSFENSSNCPKHSDLTEFQIHVPLIPKTLLYIALPAIHIVPKMPL